MNDRNGHEREQHEGGPQAGPSGNHRADAFPFNPTASIQFPFWHSPLSLPPHSLLEFEMENIATASNSHLRPNGDNMLLNADEVAQILRVPRSWVYSHLNELPAIRLGRYVRFLRSEIEHFLAQRTGTCQ